MPSPESAVGGPLALLRMGDMVSVDVERRSIRMHYDELDCRRAPWTPPAPHCERGYGWMFSRYIRQANEGWDFDFLTTGFGAPVEEPAIY